ncbi:MAG TPA: hypothetical protein PKM25_01050 [Candidatus Ozemobacteraceae bacterium]|nr:hypothetical protein [Candidatus Ozemobacteraceae bacterium]
MAAGSEIFFDLFTDGKRNRDERIGAAVSLFREGANLWRSLSDERRLELAECLAILLGNSEEEPGIRTAAAQVLQNAVDGLPPEVHRRLFDVLATTIGDGAGRKLFPLMQEACRLVSVLNISECTDEALMKRLNDAIFEAVLLRGTIEDEAFSDCADTAFGLTRNHLNKLQGDWS